MTKSLVESVIEQQIIFEVQEEEQKKLKAEIKKDRREYHQQNLDELRQSMNDGQETTKLLNTRTRIFILAEYYPA